MAHIKAYDGKGSPYPTLQEACNRANVGKATMRRIAEEAGAVMKIGRLYRINWEKVSQYLEGLAR